MALEVPKRMREPNCEGSMGRVGWSGLLEHCRLLRTILSRVLLTTLRRWIERQLLGCV